jgi:adenylate cyclase
MRRLMHLIPSTPRCKLCAAPFGRPGGLVLRYLGFGPWQPNASICRMCIRSIDKEIGGAEVEVSILFADIRDSTTVAERMSPADFSHLLNRFYMAATKAVDAENGIIDKFVGDGVIALFVPGFVGHGHAAHAIAAGRAIQAAAMDPAAGLAELPIGIAVHSGVAFVGVISGGAQQYDFTALGDPVNTAARLSSVAGAGELLVSADAARAAGWEPVGAERRTLELKGKSEPVDAWVVKPATTGDKAA